jgi:hypothetical protein
LVSLYLTNYLIGRSPLPRRQAFDPETTFGINPGFPGLSRTSGYVGTHYSPFRRSPAPEGAFALDLHVLAMPPAFALSQDQTLQLILP